MRQRTLDATAELSQEQFDFSPRPGSWSIGEILDHVSRAEGDLRANIEELVQLARSGRTPAITRTFRDLNIRPALLPEFALPFLEVPLRFVSDLVPTTCRDFLLRNRILPARNATSTEPRSHKPREILRRELSESFQRTAELFTKNSDIDYSKLIVSHPLLGTNNALELLQFIGSHEERHQSQIAAVLADSRFPKEAHAWRSH
jgi:uncharacterized damage-inducible protein DinB